MRSELKFLFGIALLCLLTVYSYANTQESGNSYDYVTYGDDPLNAKIYTLSNGLKVYMSVNKDEPRVQTYIAVRTGSKNDPPETTGLAHYLEHMLFKGTDEISATDWQREQALLEEISKLYEKHRFSNDSIEKKNIYQKIDSISYLAARLAIPNEYDKMISSLGAKGTNAYTWVDQTVYVNNIPANELEKWLMVESERFSQVALRLFHTELETVYEEFNRGQDRDGRQAWNALYAGLFPGHPYGTQTTLGEGEHLKNPSMVNIYNYFNEYYVPNNIAICLAGDLDPEKTIQLVEKYFGSYQAADVDQNNSSAAVLKEPIVKEVVGTEAEFLYMGYRLPGAGTRESMMAKLVSHMLSNGQAGLIDIDLNQKQKVLSAASFDIVMNDYGALVFHGRAKEGQSLEEVKSLLMEQINRLKKGEFGDWLIEAVVNDLRLQQIRELESNASRADKFVEAFIYDLPWNEYITELDRMAEVSKEEVMQFVQDQMNDNYVVVYKRKGTPADKEKVQKPPITPLDINREGQSDFYKEFEQLKAGRLQPEFIDYDEKLQVSTVKKSNLPFYYVENRSNETFNLYYILDMGTDHDKMMALATDYLPYLGTDKYSAEDLEKEFFKLGLKFDVYSSRDRIYVSLSGLEKSLAEGVQLFEHILTNVKPDKEAYDELVSRILKSRNDSKSDKGTILWSAMLSYAKYGAMSPFTNILSEEELRNITPATLVDKIHGLTSYEHKIFFYGNSAPGEVKKLLQKNHRAPKDLKKYPPQTEYPELSQQENKVYFVDYDMVQVEMVMLTRDTLFDKTLMPYGQVFNEYFGSGLTSIVFQEIRESKALAYAAFSSFTIPKNLDESHYVYAYVGTQADKLDDAASAIRALMDEMPVAGKQFMAAKESAMKQIEAERINKTELFWSYENAKRRGLDYDIRQDIYNRMQTMELDDLNDFFREHIAGRNFTFLVIGNKENMNMKALEKLGTVEELTLEEVFAY